MTLYEALLAEVEALKGKEIHGFVLNVIVGQHAEVNMLHARMGGCAACNIDAMQAALTILSNEEATDTSKVH